jgi:hypothetical protein
VIRIRILWSLSLSSLTTVVVAILLFAAPWARAEQRYSVFGLVLEVKSPHQFVASCKEIPGLMDAMVMPFDVRDSADLKAH